MDTDVIREFIELAKKLNFTETARALNMSQPTLSKHIGSLEKELRLTLFDRSSSNLRLTRAGADLLPYAYKILGASSEFSQKAKDLRSIPPAHLSVCGFVNEEIVLESLGRVMSSLSPSYGTNFLEVKDCKLRPVREILEDDSVDFIFDYALEEDFADDRFISSTLVGNLPWVALVNKKHLLANRESISLDDLRDEVLVHMEGTHVTDGWRFIEAACLAKGFRPNARKHYSMNLTDLVTVAFSLGDDVLILGTNFTQRIGLGVSSFTVQIPIEDKLAYFPISAVYLEDNPNPIFGEALQALTSLESQ